MVNRLSSSSLLVATQLNLGKGVVKEGLMRGKDGAKSELVSCVQLGPLAAKLKSMIAGWPPGFGRLSTTSFFHHIID